jgi:transcriptional regulator GlxA family with amidase domain
MNSHNPAHPMANGSSTRRAQTLSHSSNTQHPGSRPRDRRIQLVLMLLEENSHKQLSIEDIAQLVRLSRGRLAHLFKSEMEVSIQHYVTQIRLSKAKHHLESSFLSIKEIAASVGFQNVNRFTAHFKNHVGSTPAEYRRRSSIELVKRKELAIAKSANR